MAFWRQKAALLCTNTQRANTLQAQIENRLAGFSTRSVEVQQSSTQGTVRPNVIVQVEYYIQAEADQVWADVTTANVNGWIIAPSFATYAAMNDDSSANQILGHLDW